MDKVANRHPNIVFFFGQGAQDYRHEKARQIFMALHDGIEPSGEELDRLSQSVSGLSIATAAQIPALTDEQQAEVKLRSECLLRYVDKMSPPLDGEKNVEDFFSYLTTPFESIPASTVLLRRQTSRGEIYFIVENFGINPKGDLVVQGSSLPTRRLLLRGELGSFAVAMGKELATGLASSIGGAIAGVVWDALFPPGVPNYFEQVYEEISRRLRADVATHIKGALGNVQNAISSEYRPRKAKSNLSLEADRTDLYNKLQKYHSAFLGGSGGMIGTLMDPSYAKESFPVFLLGAGLQLAVYQEMSAVDPVRNAQGKWKSPLESSYGTPHTGTVALTAQQFAAHARQTWAKMLQERGDAIQLVHWTYTWSNLYGGGGSERRVKYSDGDRLIEEIVLNNKDEKDNEADDAAINGRCQAYKSKKLAEFVQEYKEPETVYTEWEKLITRPITLAAAAG